MKNSKKAIIISVSAVAAVGAVVAGVLAYLTDTKEVVNTLTIGDVSIELTEPSFDPSDYADRGIVPKETIPKDPTVKNTGNTGAYIKLDILVPTVKTGVDIIASDGTITQTNDLFIYTVNSGWTQSGTGVAVDIEDESSGKTASYTKYSYIYDNELDPSDSTVALFDSISLANIVDNQDVNGITVNIPITAYAIQADGIEHDEAFELYDAQFEAMKG